MNIQLNLSELIEWVGRQTAGEKDMELKVARLQKSFEKKEADRTLH